LLALSRFTTTSGDNRSLKQYVEGLKPNQTEIYYLVGDSIERLKSNPKLEQATARGVEVLLLTDPVDAFWTSAPLDFGGKPLKSLSQGDVDFSLIPRSDDSAAEPDKDKSEADEAATIASIKSVLGERVSDVKASQRLTTSASCLVAGVIRWSPPSPAIPRWPQICRSCCWSRRRFSTANCPKIRRRSPAGSASWCCAAWPAMVSELTENTRRGAARIFLCYASALKAVIKG